MVIILLILIAFSLDFVLIMLTENWLSSILELKGLIAELHPARVDGAP